MVRMRISTQIATASVVAVTAVVAIGLASHVYVRELERDADEIAEEWNEMDAITGALAVLRKSRGDRDARAQLAVGRERILPFTRRTGAEAASPPSEHETRETRMFLQIAGLLHQAEQANGEALDALGDEAEDVALSFWEEDFGRVPAQLAAIRARQRRLRAISIGTGLVLLIVPALVFAFVQLRIARPLERIQANVARIGGSAPEEGDRESTMSRLESAIGEMVRTVEARRRDLEEQVETRTLQLRHANRLGGLGRIAAAVAHEINTPLGSIALSVEGLRHSVKKNPLPREEVEGYLATAASQIDACTATTRKLLSYAHLRPQDPTRIAPGQLVHEAVELVQAHCRQRGVTVDEETDQRAPEITGDLAQLRQVIVNLLLNAADASPRGERVRVAASERGGGAAILVRDHGRGIPFDLREEIFNPFFTTKRSGEGTGLGLSIAREIVEAHGGELVLVEPEDGVGAAFRIILPAAGED
jgi:signal transduction histidine kinase